MARERICSECKNTGTEIFSRCSHILHEECFHNLRRDQEDKNCPKCKTQLCKNIEVEKLAIRLKESDFDFAEVEEMIICLANFETKHSNQNYYQKIKVVSYDENILSKLQKFGWDINGQIFGGVRLFYIACSIDDLAKVNLLIDHGLNLSKYGKNGLYYSALNSSIDTFERLLKLGINLNPKVIFNLISTKTFRALNHILKYDILDVNFEDYRSPIHAAAKTGSIRKLKILIENGADFNAVDADGNSISHYASNCKNGRPLMKYLAESGFDLDVQNKKKITPMIYAVICDNQNVLEYLIDEKVGINNRDQEGNTPLHTYSWRGEIEIVKKLLANGADVNAKNFEGKTALHIAANEKMVILLLENGAKMHELDQFGKSPFFYFHRRLSANLKIRFIDEGADLSIKNSSGESIFELMLGITR